MKFHLNRKKDIFTVCVTGHWHRLAREAVHVSALEMFKRQLDRLLNNVLTEILLEQGIWMTMKSYNALAWEAS